MRRYLKGFTIIELIVVMTIIIILAGLVAGAAQKARERALIARTRSLIAAIETGLGMFQGDLGGYPASGDVNLFNCLMSNSGSYLIGPTTYWIPTPNSNWSGPYMTFKDSDIISGLPVRIIDAWGTPLTYDNPDNSGHSGTYVDIESRGPDKVAGTADDVTNWTR